MKEAIYESLFTNADPDVEHLAQEQYNALIARLRELRDAPEPRRQDWWDHEAVAHQRLQTEWRIQRDLATELLDMLGEE